MSVFNSLGSNYDISFILKSLTAHGKTDLKNFLKKKYEGEAVLLFKGREAITLALKSLNLPKNSQVAINGFTCYAVYRAIEEAGLRPVLIDIPQDDLNFSAEDLSKKIISNPNIKVVIIQNTLGYPADAQEIAKICKENNLILIEDLAHSVGAKYANKKEAGSVGDFVILSFSQDKIIDAVSGGALVVREDKWSIVNSDYTNPSLARQLKDRFYPHLTTKIRTAYRLGLGKAFHLFYKKIEILSTPMDGSFYGLTNLPNFYQNLTLIAFKNLAKDLEHRKKIAKIYTKNLPAKIMFFKINSQIDNSSNLRFPIFMDDRDKFVKYLKSKGFYISDIWYDAPIAPKRFMNKIDYKNDCPTSEKISERILNLPTHKNISEEQALFLCKLINLWTGEEVGLNKHV